MQEDSKVKMSVHFTDTHISGSHFHNSKAGQTGWVLNGVGETARCKKPVQANRSQPRPRIHTITSINLLQTTLPEDPPLQKQMRHRN